MKIERLFLFAAIASLPFGCTTPVTKNSPPPPPWHTVMLLARPKHPPVYWYNRIDMFWWFGNCDESTPPFWYIPDGPFRDIRWHIRNPLANFTSYVIGVADKDVHRSGRYPTLVGNPHGGWNVAFTRWKFIFFPWVDYQSSAPGEGGFEFYFGWRERGNFGMALRHNPPDKAHKALMSMEKKPPKVYGQARTPLTRR